MSIRASFRLLLATCMLATSVPLAASAPAGADDDATSRGRDATRLFLEGEVRELWTRFAPAMREAMPETALAAFRDQVAGQLGGEESLLSEDTGHAQGVDVYVRVARWSKASMPIAMQWSFDADGAIAGFFVRPAAAAEAADSPHLGRDTIADLRLPFRGEWFVFWGGRTVEQNYHAVDAGQRFAYDFVVRVDGRSHRGDGRALEDYHCWDRPILAPAAGRVLAAVGNLPDQALGTTSARQPAGNHVMLDLGNGEYALLAHLRQGSLRVATGDAVAPGDELGRCGNSGNTSEPHLHFHLQDAPAFGQGKGLPAAFNDYEADGKPVVRGEPSRGERVRAR